MSGLTGPRPLLKWAGGKRQLLPAFRRFYPESFTEYYEPFVGSGAVFFDLLRRGALDGIPVTLTDVNGDLVGCYRAVRERPDAVIAALASLARRHAREGSACYYAVRERFNRERQARHASDRTAYTPRHVMLSNSSASDIEAQYRAATRAAGTGLRLWQLPARRAINSRVSGRGAVAELLLTNLDPREPHPSIVALK